MPAAPSAELKTVEEPSQWPLRERRLVLGLLAALVVIKLCYVFTLAVNSDEPQHLHVAWGWTQGQVQYRDFFDNHTPLFHLLSAPLVAVIDERANILVWMRLAMLPLYAVSLGCVFWLGARLYSRRVGMWAAFLGGTCPVFLALSTQYRADILWMTVWFVTFAVALTGRFTTRRAFAVGLLLGITFCVSLKTSLLLVSLLGAVGAALCFLPPQERRRMLAQSAGKVFLALCGLCAVPLALLGYFKWQHALQALSYCVVSHNTLPRIQT